jgi:hypothetical protein
MAVGSGLRTVKIQDKACALTATGGRPTGRAHSAGLGIVIEIDRPDMFRFPRHETRRGSPDQ